MPITAFMGVRISWLIVARKSDLARSAASAADLAACKACSASTSRVMSSMMPSQVVPWSLLRGADRQCSQRTLPLVWMMRKRWSKSERRVCTWKALCT